MIDRQASGRLVEKNCLSKKESGSLNVWNLENSMVWPKDQTIIKSVVYPEVTGTLKVSDEFANLSELELLSFIGRAEEELKRRKRASKDKIKEEIEARLQAAGINLSDLFPEAGGAKRKRKAASDGGEAREVKPKFRDPVSQETWSGRGARPPIWVKRIMAERGWSLDDFKKSGNYDV
jgi:DNA-binding protein H-NS